MPNGTKGLLLLINKKHGPVNIDFMCESEATLYSWFYDELTLELLAAEEISAPMRKTKDAETFSGSGTASSLSDQNRNLCRVVKWIDRLQLIHGNNGSLTKQTETVTTTSLKISSNHGLPATEVKIYRSSTSEKNINERQPCLFFIHGGGFILGRAEQIPPLPSSSQGKGILSSTLNMYCLLNTFIRQPSISSLTH